MHDPLDWFEPLVRTPEEAVRWACILEATAPKSGNVFPGRSFSNLSYLDFVQGAEITAACLARPGRISEGMLSAVLETSARCKTNVNLGIVLLLGPMVAADRHLQADGVVSRSPEIWRQAISQQLSALDNVDGANVYRAIASASAGGLGEVEGWDVQAKHASVDLLAAMSLASDRDQIARQYVTGYAEVIDHVAPLLHRSILQCGDILQGICRAHVRLLACEPDSLIVRKNSANVAARVQALARSIGQDDRAGIESLDASLRSPDHQLNPGTTADLIAAGLYLLLRSSTNRQPSRTIDQELS